jgi:NADH-quinone oxidoreductase subunit L
MSAQAGPLTPVEAPLVPLGSIPLALFVGAVVILLVGPRLGRRRAAAVGLGSTVLGLAFALADVARLASFEPARRYLGDVVTGLVRIGSFETNLGFALDPLAAVVLVVTLVVVALVQAHFVWRSEADGEAGTRIVGAGALLGCGASVAVLAADAVVMLFGWAIVMVATSLLVGLGRRARVPAMAGVRPLLAGSVGDAGLVCGFALLFWGLGGAWLDADRYLSDYRARFVAVHAEGRIPVEALEADQDDEPRGERDPRAISARAGKRGKLTFTSHPGARVYVGIADRAQLAQGPEPFGISPFVRRDIGAGTHAIVIEPGGGATIGGDGNENALIERVVIPEGEEVRIAPIGPTVTFREIVDQLVLRDESGRPWLRQALLAKKGAGSIGLVTLACLLLFFGVAVKSSALFPWLAEATEVAAWPASALVQSVALSLGVYLLVRLDVLFVMSPAASSVVMVAGAASAALALALCVLQRRASKALAYGSLVVLGLAFVAFGSGADTWAVGIVVVHALVVPLLCREASRMSDAPFTFRASWADKLRARRGGSLGEVVVEAATVVARAVAKLVSFVDEVFVGAPARLLERAFFPERAPPVPEAPETAPPTPEPPPPPPAPSAGKPRRKTSRRSS